MSKNNLIIGGGLVLVVIVLGLLFYWPQKDKLAVETDVPCLVANISLLQHIHPVLKITMDDKVVPLSSNIGLSGSCERAVHTHDDSGTVHVEAQDTREYKLKDFFSVWGEDLEKDGYNLEMMVDGNVNNELGELKFVDKQEIVLKYTAL